MGSRIEAAVATSPHRLTRGALRLSDEAAIACLHRAHHHADELDLLINAGIYKDFGAAEPALASIIQEDIGANPGSPPRLGHHGTFSFDVLNGGCGFLTAAQLVDQFVGSGRAHLGMVVAGDANRSRKFPFSAAAGAVLMSHVDDDDSGFRQFVFRTFPEHAHAFEAYLRWERHAGLLRRGRNVLDIRESPELARVCITRAVEVVRELGVGDEVDLLIASQYPRGFASGVAEALGLRAPRVRPELAAAHTAGPIAALEAAIESGELARAREVLFVSAGAGLTIAVARYRVSAEPVAPARPRSS